MNKLVGMLCVALVAGVAAAAPIPTLVYQDTNSGLDRYYLHVEAGDGEANCNAWTFDSASEVWHQVWSFNGQSRDLDESENDALFDNSWLPFDTHCLFVDDDFVTKGVDGYVETNDGTDPAGLGLTSPLGETFNPTVGVGAYDQLGAALLTESTASSMDIIQLVVPAGTPLQLGQVGTFAEPYAAGSVAAPGHGDTQFEIGIPEPATFGVLAVGGVAMLIRRRR